MKSEKVRVYEFAKKNNLSSKELIKILKKGGFDVSSHMAVLEQKALEYLNKTMQKASSPKPEKKEQIKIMPRIQSRKKSKTISSKKPKVDLKQVRPTIKNELQVPEKSIKAIKKDFVVTSMTPGDFAVAIGESVAQVILTLLKWGVVAPKNQILDEDIVARLAQHFELTIIQKKPQDYEAMIETKIIADHGVQKEKLEERPPVVVVMGHVDHGKTTLLDFVRKTRVAAKEKGGITQHLGAYEVETKQGSVIFLDTPGHEAFTKIRMRGAKVADLVVLVVAADDSIMPQTVEAIRHAKAMDIPIIVAINKVDKVEQHQIEAVKRDLSQHDLLPEDWGGDIVCVPISAKLGQGVDHLLEMISLQSQMIGLESDKTVSARGFILESKLEKGRGPVATLICQHGVIKRGDFFVCGNTSGKVSSLIDSYGKQIKSAGPSVPVQVAGFSELPEAGDFLQVVSQREFKKARSSKPERVVTSKIISTKGDFNLIIKTDTKSSLEALIGSIVKLSKKLEKGFSIIHSAVGDINESDIALSANTGSMLVGLHVKIEPNAAALARRNSINIKLFDIIYKLVEDLEEFSESTKEIKKVKTKIGEAVVLKVFDIKKIGVIAGCAVKTGRCTRDSSLVIWRGNTKVGEGKIKSLQREKKVVKEVHAGFECGFLIENFRDWEVDDRVECYLEIAPDQKK